MAAFYYFFLYLIVNLIIVESYKILVVVPTPSFSHQVVFRPLTQELAKRGHEVVVVTTDPAFPKGDTPANLTEIDFHDLSYTIWNERFMALSKGNKEDNEVIMANALDLQTIIFEKQVQSEEFQKILRENNTFDLLLLESWARQPLALSHVIKVPVIQVSSFGAYFFGYFGIGAPTHPLLYPAMTQQKLINRTLWDKVTEVYNYYKLCNFLDAHEIIENEMIRRVFGPDVPTLTELNNNVDMLLLNIHPIFEGNYPVPPGVIYMAGFYPQFQNELPQDLKSFLDASKHGVIYLSFGTNCKPSNLPQEKIQIFVKVLSQLPYDVLWKWDTDNLPGKYKNIRIAKWLPQSDLLRHPKIKLFIMQGGLQSTEEALVGGVPMLGIPMLGDQWFNTEKYIHLGIGDKLEMETLTEEDLRAAINKLILDKRYRQNVKRLHALMVDQPQPPLERAIWWIEYVLRHGGARHLRAPAANMPWTQYYEVELVLIVFSILLSIIVLSSIILYYLYKFVTSNLLMHKKLKDQ